MIFAAIVAGGSGLRMGANVPKQFLEISGKPVLIHTVSCFTNKVDRIVIVCHKNYVEHTKQLLRKYNIPDTEVIPGGKDRMASVIAAVDYFLKDGDPEDVILTHDGVRPFVTGEMIDKSIENAQKGHFSTIAVKSTDTVCIAADGENIDSVPEREGVFNIQTPQTFTLGKLSQMLSSATHPEKFTDLCGLALEMGEKIKIIEGSPENIKITVPADLAVAEAIVGKRYENR